MSEFGPLRPTDLVALAAFARRGRQNEAWTWNRLGAPPRGLPLLPLLAAPLVPWRGRRATLVYRQRRSIRGLVSLQRLHGRGAGHVDQLVLPGADTDRVALALLDRVSAVAARAGMTKVYLRLAAGSVAIAAARDAGFVPYATEHLLHLDGAPPNAPPALGSGRMLRGRERADDHALYRLYNAATPAATRMIEALSLSEWLGAAEPRSGSRGAADLVLDIGGGEVGAWVRTARSRVAARLDLLIAPDLWPATEALVAWGLHDLGGDLPVLALVREYAAPVLERMASMGFVAVADFRLLAKRLAQPVPATEAARAPGAVRGAAKPAVTM